MNSKMPELIVVKALPQASLPTRYMKIESSFDAS